MRLRDTMNASSVTVEKFTGFQSLEVGCFGCVVVLAWFEKVVGAAGRVKHAEV